MALTPSNMLPLGTTAPDFTLTDTEGNSVSLSTFKGAKGYLIMFICNHCPYVKHIRKPLAEVTSAFLEKGLAVVGINSNDAKNYPEDSPAKMKEEKKAVGYEFPYLFDETQSVAKAYQAACTPDFYLFDRNLKLVYRGQFDESRPNSPIAPTGKDLSAAVEQVLRGQAPNPDQRPSIGCNIKWKG